VIADAPLYVLSRYMGTMRHWTMRDMTKSERRGQKGVDRKAWTDGKFT
jgi:hypothetical protein